MRTKEISPLIRLQNLIDRVDQQRLAPRIIRTAVCKAAGLEHIYQFRFRPTRVVIAAAGRGSRFGTDEPKVLAKGKIGRALILRVLDVLTPFDPHPIVVINSETGPTIAAEVANDARHTPVWVFQEKQLGMGHAVLQAEVLLSAFRGNIVVAWGDMGAVSERLVLISGAVHQILGCTMTIPTKWRLHPYVALLRSQSGSVLKVLQRKEEDTMPEAGESDCGIFWIQSPEVFSWLRELDMERLAHNASSELNFLSLVALLAARSKPAYAVRTGVKWESQGVNTSTDLEVADICFKKIQTQALRDLSSCHTLPSLLDVVTCSTVESELWPYVQRVLSYLRLDYTSFCDELSQGKQRAIKQLTIQLH